MAFLDYLLGGVSGGFEGYERKKAKELQAQKDEEERQFRIMTTLNQLGFRATGLVQPDTEPLAEPLAQPFGANINTTAPKPAFDTTMGRAFEAANQRDMKTKPIAPGSFEQSQQRAFEGARQRAFGVTPETGMSRVIGTALSAAATAPAPRSALQRTKYQLIKDALADSEKALKNYMEIDGKASGSTPEEIKNHYEKYAPIYKSFVDKEIAKLDQQASGNASGDLGSYADGADEANTIQSTVANAIKKFQVSQGFKESGYEANKIAGMALLEDANRLMRMKQVAPGVYNVRQGEAAEPASMQNTPLRQALASARPTDSQMKLDDSRIPQFERARGMQAANPETQINVKGIGRIGFAPPETADQKKAKEDAAFEQSIAGFSEEQKRIARLARVLPPNVLQAITQTKEPKATSLQYIKETGQYFNPETGEIFDAKGAKIPPKEPRTPQTKSMPEGSRKRLEGYESGIFMVRDAIGMLNESPQAVGPLKGRVWRAALDAYDKAGVGVRAYLENLAGEIRNQRFGGALTATEAKFAESMLPSDKDLAENAITKLNQLEKYLEQKRRALYKINKMEYEPMFPSEASSQKANPYRDR